jgi:hypothetical protein
MPERAVNAGNQYEMLVVLAKLGLAPLLEFDDDVST